MQVAVEQFITEEEYWELEARSELKHEYFNGEIFAMSGGSPDHAVLAMNTGAALLARLRGKSCRVAGSDQRVKVEATGLMTYPDVVVYCRPWHFDARNTDTLLTPTLIVEVLSPSTLNYDKGAKFDNYKQIESLRDYLLIARDKIQVDHYHRLDNGDWLLHTATGLAKEIKLEALECSLALAELYRNIEPDNEPYSLHEPT